MQKHLVSDEHYTIRGTAVPLMRLEGSSLVASGGYINAIMGELASVMLESKETALMGHDTKLKLI